MTLGDLPVVCDVSIVRGAMPLACFYVGVERPSSRVDEGPAPIVRCTVCLPLLLGAACTLR